MNEETEIVKVCDFRKLQSLGLCFRGLLTEDGVLGQDYGRKPWVVAQRFALCEATQRTLNNPQGYSTYKRLCRISSAMRKEDLSSAAPGRLVSVGKGPWAFVPDPLPPELAYGPRLVRALSEADRALGELASLGRTLPNPYLLTQPFLRREAVLSSRIEGTQASLVDLYAFEAETPLFDEPERRDDVQEVQNYVRALEHGMARLEDLPISVRLLREMHAVLMEGVRGVQRDPGDFRRIQNWIGPPGAEIGEATYVPPPPGEIPATLGALESYVYEDTGLPLWWTSPSYITSSRPSTLSSTATAA